MTLPAALRAPVDVTDGDLSDALTVIGHARTAATAIERADRDLTAAARHLRFAAESMRDLMAMRGGRLSRTRLEAAELAFTDAWRDVERAMRELEGTRE